MKKEESEKWPLSHRQIWKLKFEKLGIVLEQWLSTGLVSGPNTNPLMTNHNPNFWIFQS